jgi:hypothetical protein
MKRNLLQERRASCPGYFLEPGVFEQLRGSTSGQD